MLSVLEKLFNAPHPAVTRIHAREALTPGRLYRLMSAEFRAFRSERCSCVMPMLSPCERAHSYACNWAVGALGTSCDSCQPLVDEIVARHRAVYDVNDPTMLPSMQSARDGEPVQATSAGFPLFA